MVRNMDMRITVVVFIFVFCIAVDGGGLSYSYYEKSCPHVENIVRAGVASILLADPTSPAAFLRLMFHDCQVQGCDASILLDSGARDIFSEMASSKNFGVRKREAIWVIKSTVEAKCPRQVSCADIVVLAAREAIVMSGGPQISVPLGRRDSTTTSYKIADASLPSVNIGVDGMLRIFAERGMTIEESVAILGSQTLGITHCLNIHKRLNRLKGNYNSGEMGPGLESFLRLSCPPDQGSLISNSTFVANDLTTLTFDNQYYRDITYGRGILRIDAEMATDPRTAPIVARFAINQNSLFQSFSSAFVKLSYTGVLTENQGMIRKKCNAID